MGLAQRQGRWIHQRDLAAGIDGEGRLGLARLDGVAGHDLPAGDVAAIGRMGHGLGHQGIGLLSG